MNNIIHSSSLLRWRALLAALCAVALAFAFACGGAKKDEVKPAASEKAEAHHDEGEANEVSLSPEALAAAKLEFAEVAARTGGGVLRVTGSVEINQQQMQQATPLVSGRVERVNVVLGDRVRAGQPLAVIASPQIAQMHGKLHEAETKLALAERNLKRVEQAENRAAVLSAKARLYEAEANLSRTR